jgi:hypothetical protein
MQKLNVIVEIKSKLTEILAIEIPTNLMPDSFSNENGFQRVIYVLHPTQKFHVQVKNMQLYPDQFFCIMKSKFTNLQIHKWSN